MEFKYMGLKEWFQINIVDVKNLLIAFIIAQLINVIISTLKSVLTIKGTRITATLINAISYTVNAGVISQIGKVDNIIIVCVVTCITNLIGVWFSLWLLDKLRKDQLWRISATVKTEYKEQLMKELDIHNIMYLCIANNWHKFAPLDIFSTSKEESKIIKQIFIKYKVKYTISVNKGEL